MEIQNNFFKFLTTEERLVVKRTGENNKISMIKRMLKGKDIVVDKLSILDDGWDFSLKEGLRITKMVDGRAFFLGGGGIVGQGIDYAYDNKIKFKIYSNDIPLGLPNASGDLAQKYPEHVIDNMKLKKIDIPDYLLNTSQKSCVEALLSFM